MTRRLDLMDSGTAVGTLEITSSLFPLFLRSFFVALFGSTCGVVIFVTLRAVALAEKSLRKSEEKLTVKVSRCQGSAVGSRPC